MNRCRARRFAAALAFAALGVGCGGVVLDDDKTEAAIEDSLRKSPGRDVTSVDCPSGVEVDPGATFECTVRLAGGREETARLRIRNEDADVSLVKLSGGNS